MIYFEERDEPQYIDLEYETTSAMFQAVRRAGEDVPSCVQFFPAVDVWILTYFVYFLRECQLGIPTGVL